MASIREIAKTFESKQTNNVADLEKVSVDITLRDGQFEMVDEDGKPKVVKYKYIIKDGVEYRVPNSVLKQLREQLDANPSLTEFKVSKKGKGLNTDYTVIPIFPKEEQIM